MGIIAGSLFNLCAPGSQYLQENFNYQPGLLGTNSGWTSPAKQITVISGNLGYPSLASLSPAGHAASVAQGTLSSTLRSFDSTATSGNVYCSFLIKYTSVGTNVFIAGLLPSSAASPVNNTTDPCDLVVISATGGTVNIRKGGGIASGAWAQGAQSTVPVAQSDQQTNHNARGG